MEVDQSRSLSSSSQGVGVVKTLCLWKGKLLVKGGLFCNVEMRTDNDVAGNKAFL